MNSIYKQNIFYILIIGMIWSETIVANESNETTGSEIHSMNEMLLSIKLERKQVEKIVEKLVSTGRLTPEEGARARREIASVKDSDLEAFKINAIHELSQK